MTCVPLYQNPPNVSNFWLLFLFSSGPYKLNSCFLLVWVRTIYGTVKSPVSSRFSLVHTTACLASCRFWSQSGPPPLSCALISKPTIPKVGLTLPPSQLVQKWVSHHLARWGSGATWCCKKHQWSVVPFCHGTPASQDASHCPALDHLSLCREVFWLVFFFACTVAYALCLEGCLCIGHDLCVSSSSVGSSSNQEILSVIWSLLSIRILCHPAASTLSVIFEQLYGQSWAPSICLSISHHPYHKKSCPSLLHPGLAIPWVFRLSFDHGGKWATVAFHTTRWHCCAV